ncbi:hypothetical protein [Lewinella sp. 4G2]|uniref:hypothetical protein n=1 Tax=Lewinella sp. 4G2 TaxID=1803372 RepID=UPI0007B47FF1|nr:hypothetical protein [Lewinella sp. 4G2]OAV43044.1 hypothetical protein A3850_000360 [Lewinella sp. 4G2]
MKLKKVNGHPATGGVANFLPGGDSLTLRQGPPKTERAFLTLAEPNRQSSMLNSLARAYTLVFVLFYCSTSPALVAQDFTQFGEYGVDWGGYLFGVKGGLSAGNQDWSGLETEFLLGYHGALYLETIPAGGRFSFYGQLGYHTRGSRISRRRAFRFDGNQVTLPSFDFRFQNISLGAGAKSVVAYTQVADLYYSLGLRIEYSISNNLSKYDNVDSNIDPNYRLNFPFDSPDTVNEVVYGASFGGGAVFPLGETTSAFIELTAHPDLSFQYNQGPIENVIDPFSANTRTIGARMIRNFTIELSVGIRFLRKWDYID